MLSSFAIAVQGIGLGSLAIAVQGFLPIDSVPVPQEPPAVVVPSGAGPISRLTDVKVKVQGHAKVRTPRPIELHPVLKACGAATVGIYTSSTESLFPVFGVKGKAKVSLSTQSAPRLAPTMQAKGFQSASDEELAAMVMLLLDL